MDIHPQHTSPRDSVIPGAAGRETRARSRWVAAGGIIGALTASSCCIIPLLLFSMGVSGAWIGTLTGLAPYKPFFIAATAGFLGYGYWLVYKRPDGCSDGAACARPLPNRMVKAALWGATALVVVALFWNWIAPVLAPLLLGL